jgi:hypothetical protein
MAMDSTNSMTSAKCWGSVRNLYNLAPLISYQQETVHIHGKLRGPSYGCQTCRIHRDFPVNTGVTKQMIIDYQLAKRLLAEGKDVTFADVQIWPKVSRGRLSASAQPTSFHRRSYAAEKTDVAPAAEEKSLTGLKRKRSLTTRAR